MWIWVGLVSMLFLGIYDVFKKHALRENAVLLVLFLSNLASSLMAVALLLGSVRMPHAMATWRTRKGWWRMSLGWSVRTVQCGRALPSTSFNLNQPATASCALNRLCNSAMRCIVVTCLQAQPRKLVSTSRAILFHIAAIGMNNDNTSK